MEEEIETKQHSILDLNQMRDSIENMSKFNQVEILRILKNHSNVTLNENKYGVHVNLTELPENIIDELNVYIHYVNTQEIALNQIEQQIYSKFGKTSQYQKSEEII